MDLIFFEIFDSGQRFLIKKLLGEGQTGSHCPAGTLLGTASVWGDLALLTQD